MGKSPGLGVADSNGVFSALLIVFGILTVSLCCAYGLGEPSGQDTICGIGFEFVLAHALEQCIEVNVLTAVDPLALCVDLRVGLDSRHSRCGCDVHFASLLDNSLQG